MNVIVSNKNQGLLSSLDIDVIKSINGQFTADEIISTFSNFFFNRMFLDITAIKDYYDIRVENDIEKFKAISDIIVANRYSSVLDDIKEKVYTRDLFERD